MGEQDDIFCEICWDAHPAGQMVDCGFTGPDGERHDRWLCEACHLDVADDE